MQNYLFESNKDDLTVTVEIYSRATYDLVRIEEYANIYVGNFNNTEQLTTHLPNNSNITTLLESHFAVFFLKTFTSETRGSR